MREERTLLELYYELRMALALANCMINSNEKHSEKSKRIINHALDTKISSPATSSDWEKEFDEKFVLHKQDANAPPRETYEWEDFKERRDLPKDVKAFIRSLLRPKPVAPSGEVLAWMRKLNV